MIDNRYCGRVLNFVYKIRRSEVYVFLNYIYVCVSLVYIVSHSVPQSSFDLN